jgi:hypothetical protein
MGGKPSKATPKDMRLKANNPNAGGGGGSKPTKPKSSAVTPPSAKKEGQS